MWFKRWQQKNFLFMFTEQVNLLYRSGIPLSQALQLMQQEQKQGVALNVLKHIEKNLSRGQNLYVCLKKHRDIFPHFYLCLIELGEQSGRLQEVLQNLSQSLANTNELKRKVMSALFYPLTVLIINCLVVFALLWFVVPQYAGFFGANWQVLPMLTQLLLNLSLSLHQYLGFYFLFIIILVFVLKFLFKQTYYRQRLLQKLTHCYGFKHFIKLHDLAMISRSLSLCLQSGLNLTRALELCKPLSFDHRWQIILAQTSKAISQGKSFSAALKKYELPALMLQLIFMGESTGQLQEQLLKVALIYEVELADKLTRLTRLIEPAMMLMLGALIGLIMYALYQPLMQLGNLV